VISWPLVDLTAGDGARIQPRHIPRATSGESGQWSWGHRVARPRGNGRNCL